MESASSLVRHWLAPAAMGVALAVWTWRTGPRQPVEEPSVVEAEVAGQVRPEAEPTGLGEAAAATSSEEAPQSSLTEAMAEDSPPEALPGQVRPDANGRCPRKQHVALNGGCWVEMSNREECEEIGYVFKGKCYAPALPRGRQPTSSPKSPR